MLAGGGTISMSHGRPPGGDNRDDGIEARLSAGGGVVAAGGGNRGVDGRAEDLAAAAALRSSRRGGGANFGGSYHRNNGGYDAADAGEPDAAHGSDGWPAGSAQSLSTSGLPLRVTNPDAFKSVEGGMGRGGNRRGSNAAVAGVDGRKSGEGDGERDRLQHLAREARAVAGRRDDGRGFGEHRQGARGEGLQRQSQQQMGSLAADGVSAAAAVVHSRPVPTRLSGLAAIIAARSEDSPEKLVWRRIVGGGGRGQ